MAISKGSGSRSTLRWRRIRPSWKTVIVPFPASSRRINSASFGRSGSYIMTTDWTANA
ncbi:MAG: hypothetical protein ABIK65_00870 [Candidatus Eisenbacteria bacterium]